MNENTPLHTLDAKCKFCGTPVELQVDPAGYAMFSSGFLASIAACNRCGDLHNTRIVQTDRASHAAGTLITARQRRTETDKIKSACKAVFESATRIWCQALSSFYRMPSFFDPEIAESLMDRPDKAAKVMRHIQSLYEREYNSRTRQAELQHTNQHNL